MNIVNKLTIRNLKKNKRRTLVTIIGVIISVAMITAVATLAVSFLDLMKKQSIADEGEWHVLYKDVNEEQLKAIKKNENTETVITSIDAGFAEFEGSNNKYQPYLFLKKYNEQGFTHFPIKLSDGRLPTNENEIVISDHIKTNSGADFAIGDLLEIDVGDRYSPEFEDYYLGQTFSITLVDGENIEVLKNKQTETFKIVGIIERPTWEPASAPGYTIISYLDEKSLSATDTVNATVVLKDVNKSLYDDAKILAKEIGVNEEAISFNNSLLRFYGITNQDGLNRTLYSLTTIIMLIIIIGSVSLIYNAFAISVSERSRQLGMLASVGATKRQKRNSVFFEGIIISLISIPLGLISGFIGIGITLYYINTLIEGALGVTEKLSLTVTPMSIVTAITVSILTIFISTYIPAKRAAKVSAIDAIRQSMDVKLTRKAVKTSKLVRKFFGIEAEIGLKNLKRNKRRYIATVFSLVISIVLFLTVAFFTDNLKKSVGLSQEGYGYDIFVTQDTEDEESWQQFTKSVSILPDVTNLNIAKSLYMAAWLDKDEVDKQYRDSAFDYEDEYAGSNKDKFPYLVNVYSIDDKTMSDYIKEVGLNDNQLVPKADSLPAIVIDTAPFYDNEANKYIETKTIYTQVGKKIELLDQHELDDVTFRDTIEVVALTDKYPIGIDRGGYGNLTVIVSEQSFDQLIYEDFRKELYLTSSDPLKTQHEIESMDESSVYINNIYQNRQEEEQFITILSVFSYGFITLITLISIANIFNTISTSISLRTREFGMLKSVGMTPKGFNKMINYESIFYGVKSLLYGLPLSIIIMIFIHKSLMHTFDYRFELPWFSIFFVIVTIFIIVGSAMLYSSSKVKKENIIDALKQENI